MRVYSSLAIIAICLVAIVGACARKQAAKLDSRFFGDWEDIRDHKWLSIRTTGELLFSRDYDAKIGKYVDYTRWKASQSEGSIVIGKCDTDGDCGYDPTSVSVEFLGVLVRIKGDRFAGVYDRCTTSMFRVKDYPAE
jgi:hypothetical protein